MKGGDPWAASESEERTRRVLAVEDDPDAAEMVRRILERAGFEVKVALDGFQCGSLLGSWRPAVVTLDLNMPGLSGMDVLRFLRETELLAGVKVLVVSAMPEEALATAVAAGADGALRSPYAPRDLVREVCALAGVPVPANGPADGEASVGVPGTHPVKEGQTA